MNNVTTTLLTTIIRDVSNIIIQNMINELKSSIFPFIIDEMKNKCEVLFEICQKPFSELNSEYLLLKHLKSLDLYKPAEKFTINAEVTEVMKKGVAHLDKQTSIGILIPIQFQIRKFFELPGVLEKTLENTSNKVLENNISLNISSIVHGTNWKLKTKHLKNRNVIPFNLYYDDFETGNALGSHAGNQSIAAFYFNFPTLPQNCSSLSTIFPAMFVKTTVIKKYGYNKSVSRLIHVLQNLGEDGMVLNIKGKEFLVFFILGNIVGDNLGLNCLLGFSPSFNHKYFCRFCKVMRDEINNFKYEDSTKLRTIQNYNDDMDQNDYKLTGIKFESDFNKLQGFHVTENFCVDIMHDCFEGIIKYGLSNAISYFIKDKQYFSLDELNNRIKYFEYGELQCTNRIPLIKEEHLKNKKLHMSARESLKFLQFFSLLIGDKVTQNDRVWKYVCLLDEVVELLLYDSFTETIINLLRGKIALHNEMYLNVFNDQLKPKHHILLHYPTIIMKSGPPIYFWCMRFESKHREMKCYTNVTSSRKNLPLSIAKKCLSNYAFNILENIGFQKELIIHKVENENSLIIF